MGRRLLPHLQGGMRADRPCGEPEHRHGDRLLGASRRRGSAPPRRGRLPLLPLRARRITTSSASTRRAAPTSGPSSRRRGTRCRPAGAEGGIGTPDQLRAHCAISRKAASTRSPSSSRAAATRTSTSARRSSCSPSEVMPEFQAREIERADRRSGKSSRPTSKRRWRASRYMKPIADEEIPVSRARPQDRRGRHRHRTPEAERQIVGRCRQGDLERSCPPRHQDEGRFLIFSSQRKQPRARQISSLDPLPAPPARWPASASSNSPASGRGRSAACCCRTWAPTSCASTAWARGAGPRSTSPRAAAARSRST